MNAPAPGRGRDDAGLSAREACRRFVVDLGAHIDRPQGHAELRHAEECATCAEHLRSARLQARVLRALPPVALPRQPAQPLAGVYDRILRSAERSTGPLVAQAMQPVRAPADVAWREVGERADLDLGPSLGRHWPAARAPGWMWRRIRREVDKSGRRPVLPRRQWAVGARLGSAAAALVVLLWILLPERPSPGTTGSAAAPQGTLAVDSLVWDLKSEPLDPSLSLGALVHIGRG